MDNAARVAPHTQVSGTLMTHTCPMLTMIALIALLVLFGFGTTALAADAGAPATQPSTGLVVRSPLDFQVVQRDAHGRGDIRVSGRAMVDCDTVELMMAGPDATGIATGHNWEPMALDPVTRTFNEVVSFPAGGWYKVELHAKKDGKTVARASVPHVGVGEVFLIAGQSNSTNSGGEGKLDPESGMVATFSGSDWRIANDPQPGVHDQGTGGSPWPAFGDAMNAKFKVPIGIASTGHGGSSTNQWQPGSEFFNWMMTRARQLGPQGFRAVLWHQGESDVGMTSDEYAAKLTAIIEASKREAGWEFPWVVAQVSYHSPAAPSHASTREAQKWLWEQGVALEGPDTDTLGGDHRDGGGQGIHFSPKGLKAHGRMWAEKVGAYLERVIAK